ncbi:MerR family DNA-binding transcriptional regulator, partial [Streptomyces anulatus]
MRIGELAEQAGTTTRTLRYYESRGGARAAARAAARQRERESERAPHT